ncbi:MAG: formyltransferase family protein, partial [Planctomycetota bacterium]
MTRESTTSETGTRLIRVVCVGSNQETECVLRGLHEQQANIVGLVTLPARRDQGVCDYVDLHQWCAAHDIATIDTVDINSAETLEAIAALRPDYIYTLGWSQIFGDRLIQIPSRYVVGSHPSPLPSGRGRAPVPWTILEAQQKSAVTLFRMDAGVDSGAILCQEWFEVAAEAYAQDVYQAVASNLRRAFLKVYQAHASGTPLPEVPQTKSEASYRAKRTPADGHLDFGRPAEEISRLIRAVSKPYPGAYTYYAGTKITVWECSLDAIPA